MVTLNDVAREAGVSLATASRAINGSRDRVVKPELKARVLAAAAKLNYAPNAAAQAMARGHTALMGLVVHDIADPFFSSIAAGVMEATEGDGTVVTLFSTQNQLARKLQVLDALRAQRAQSVILAGGSSEDADGLAELRSAIEQLITASDATVTLIGQQLGDLPSVTIDNEAAAGELADALLGLGYREFAILTGPDAHGTARARAAGFSRSTLAGGGRVIVQVASSFDRDGGYAAMQRVLAGDRPEVVFAATDIMAIGAMSALRAAGLEPGRDIAVAGFDDIPSALDMHPELTTVHVPLEELGRRAVELARNPSAAHVTLPTHVKLRASTPAL